MCSNSYAIDLYRITINDSDFFNYITQQKHLNSLVLKTNIQKIYSAKLTQIKNWNVSIPGKDDFTKEINFWYFVYSQISTNQILLHAKDDVSKVYAKVDFSNLYNILNIFQASAVQTYIGKYELYSIIPSLPKNTNFRIQTGQKEKFLAGLKRSKPYKEKLLSLLDKYSLPSSLIALPFLESHFSLRAESRVGAFGAWQVMPHIAKRIFPDFKESNLKHPLYSALGALKIMKQNLRSLKGRLDLAINSYNSGTGFFLRKIRQKGADVSLRSLIDEKGFASKNFYPAFMAIYKYLIENQFISNKYPTLHVYMSRCTGNLDPELEKINSHLSENITRGDILFSYRELAKKKFQIIPDRLLRTHSPKRWKKKLKLQSCSIR